jgi:hypothetical protein
MVVYKSTDESGKTYYRYGFKGKKYYFATGDEKAETEAKRRATIQETTVKNKIAAGKINLTTQHLFYDT